MCSVRNAAFKTRHGMSGDLLTYKVREPNLYMKREEQQGATIRSLLLTSVSTCFGHHYPHLQENKGPVTAFGVYWSVTSGKA